MIRSISAISLNKSNTVQRHYEKNRAQHVSFGSKNDISNKSQPRSNIMNNSLFKNLKEETRKQFLEELYPAGHKLKVSKQKFMQLMRKEISNYLKRNIKSL